MSYSTDQQLLRDYTGCSSDTAFAELVRRHIDFVYSAALRMVRDGHLAEDVAQGVFMALANNAPQLLECNALEGWLHGTTRNLAANIVRSEVRRRNHEQEAAIMNEILSPGDDLNWEHIAPHLDEALGGLNEQERDALLLRYFKNQDFRAVGLALGVSDDTAQKRVSRAVEKLREFFTKRKITIGVGSLGILISANAVQAAPVGLAGTISTAVLTGTAAASTIIATTKTIAMTTLQKTFVAATVAVLAGAGIYEARQTHDARAEAQRFQEQQAALAGQVRQLQGDFADATNRLAGLRAENARLKSNSNEVELLTLRGRVTRFENEANDPVEKSAKAWLNRVNKLKDRLEKTPEANIPELKLVTDQDWLSAVKGNPLDSDVDYRRALSALRGIEENKVASMFKKALSSYMQSNDKQFPTDLSQLQSYFDSPLDDSILQRWEIAPASTIKSLGMGGSDIITQTSPVDEVFDSRYGVGPNGFGTTDFLQTTGVYKTMQPVFDAYRAAHNGQWQNDMSELTPYATTPEQQAALQKLIMRNSRTSD